MPLINFISPILTSDEKPTYAGIRPAQTIRLRWRSLESAPFHFFPHQTLLEEILSSIILPNFKVNSV